MIRTFLSTFCVIVFILVSLVLFSSGCLDEGSPELPTSTSAQIAPEDWYTLYFTDPEDPAAGTYRGGPDEALTEAIDQAKLSVDMAIYSFNLWGLRNALLDAHRRGVTVRVVTESDNLDEIEIQELIEAGIPVLGDRREGRMHNKFIVIDRQEVWTGSMNYTVSEAYQNNNNMIRVRSSRLAENYLTEFEEMFIDDHFGPKSPLNTPYPSLSVEGTQLEVYFSPEDGTAAHLMDLIKDAQESIYFMAYSFTSDDIATAMLERAKSGVTVVGVFETSQYRSNIGTEFDHLLSGGAVVRLDGNPRNMHHKVIIIDMLTVVTGSYNFSASAEDSNDENTLIIHNAQIASQYLEEFVKVFSQAQQ